MLKSKPLIATIFLLLFLTYLYGTVQFPLRGEEANRILTAYEMVYFHDFFNLTHLGEPYYSKPPLFMWLVALSSSIWGWGEFSARLISVISSFLTAFLVYLFAWNLLRDKTTALLSSLILLTFGDLAVFYGFLAEIDAFHMFITFLGIFLPFLFLQNGKETLAFIFVGLITALAFLTKGLPALYHIPLSFLILLFYFGRLKSLFSLNSVWGLLSLFLPLGFWYINLKSPLLYLKTLWNESFSRTPVGGHSRFFKHFLMYPLLNLKQLLPYSLSLPFLKFEKRKELILLGTLIFFNYLPYLISPGARGRYIMVVFPFLAVLFAYFGREFFIRTLKGKVFYTLFGLLILLYILSLGFFMHHWNYFSQFNGIWLFFLLIPLIFLWLVYRVKEYIILFIALAATVKTGFINFYAPIKAYKHPEREIAKTFSRYIPKGSVITYLPKDINMELCAYLDIYTEGIVLRKRGTYGVTKEEEVPEGVKVIKTYKAWVLFEFLNSRNLNK
jgi:4-amino-4-deoxy-L-arabinose transferase-like glycosyltransferase